MSEDSEKQRLEELHRYNILDSLPDDSFDDITKIAAQICGVPIALISFVDKDRQWFKSNHGLQVRETPREYSFCAHAIQDPTDTFVVPDALKDTRFEHNPLTTGEPHVVFYAGAPLLSTQGIPLGTLCVIDNRPRNLDTDQLEALKALARQVVAQLELRKKMHELETMTEKLEKANAALDRFAYSCSHDIKSPLASITQLSELLVHNYGGVLAEEGQKYLDYMQLSVRKVNRLVDGILTYSRVPQMMQDEKVAVSIKDMFDEIVQTLPIPERMSVSLKSNVDQVVTHPIALQQILQNLISNAIKYNDKSEGFVEVRVTDTKATWIFSVEDNGIGISKKHQEEVFTVFKTLGIKDRYGKTGDGIGLATVKALVETLGGSISLTSSEKKGSKFVFSIKK